MTYKNNPCTETDYSTITAVAQTATLSAAYDAADVTFTYDPYTVTPSLCMLTVTCDSATFPDGTALTTCPELSSNALVLNYGTADYTDRVWPPGDYTYTYKVEDEAAQTASFSFTVTLVDPCDGPVSVEAAGLTDQVYTITNTDYADYTHPDFTVNPSYCPLTYTYVVSSLSNGNSAITGTAIADTTAAIDKEVFAFLYNADLTPVTPNEQT